MGLTASTDGPAKALAAALVARDADSSASPGSGYAVGAARTQSTTVGEEWKTTWGVTTAGLDAWTAANTTKGPATLWWDACKTLTAAVDTWHTNWSTKSAQLTVGTMTQTVEGSTSCDLATGTWVTNNSDA